MKTPNSNRPPAIAVPHLETAQQLVADGVVADAHGHPQAVVPTFIRRFAERVANVPADPLASLRPGKVNVAVVTAVGDPMATALDPAGPLNAVHRQLAATRKEAFTAGFAVSPSVIDVGHDSAPRVVLGIEGADSLNDTPDNLFRLYDAGVRVVGLVHYADNAFGTIGTSIVGRRGSRRVHTGRRRVGLTRSGEDLVSEMNRLGIVVDVAHADATTILDVCQTTSAPIICSHTGAAHVRDFPRYINDSEIEAIAATGGVIGLWPAKVGSMAMNDLTDFARHADHLVELVGAEHVCIGTDKNGVTGYAHGYRGSQDFPNLAAALLQIGLTTSDVSKILGENLLRVMADIIHSPAAPPPVTDQPGGHP